MNVLDDRWEQIIGRPGPEEFPEFLRAHWISRHSLVRLSGLFKVIRDQTDERRGVFALLQEIEEDVDTYLALVQPDASEWSLEKRRYARTLRMFGVRQHLPFLLAARRRLGEADFISLLRAIVAISFLYNVIGNYQANEQERAYHSEARRIDCGEHKNVRQVLEGLRSVYPEDDQFRASFATKSMDVRRTRNRRIVCYILCEIEYQVTGIRHDFESSELSIEHICPTRPDTGWEHFSDEDIDAMTSRLGNMLLLETGSNREAGNASYEAKRVTYAQSAYQSTRDLADGYAEWAPERIDARQSVMAKTATAIWRIAQFG